MKHLFASEIKERVDCRKVLDCLGVDYFERENELRAKCPIHKGEHHNFSFNMDTGIWSCWSRHCGEEVGVSRDVFLLVMLMRGCSFSESVDFLNELMGLSSTLPHQKKEYRPKKKPNKQISEALLENFSNEPHPYLFQRGLTIETIKEFGVRYAKEGPYKGRIIFPIRNECGKLVGISGRLIEGEGSKYRNMMNFSSGMVLYGLDKADLSQKKVVLTEGFFDVMMARQNGIENVVGTMGSNIVKEQIELIKDRVDKVLLAYDGDEPGRNGAWRVFKRIESHFSDVEFIDIPDGSDLGSLTVLELWDLLGRTIGPEEYYQKRKGEIKCN